MTENSSLTCFTVAMVWWRASPTLENETLVERQEEMSRSTCIRGRKKSPLSCIKDCPSRRLPLIMTICTRYDPTSMNIRNCRPIPNTHRYEALGIVDLYPPQAPPPHLASLNTEIQVIPIEQSDNIDISIEHIDNAVLDTGRHSTTLKW